MTCRLIKLRLKMGLKPGCLLARHILWTSLAMLIVGVTLARAVTDEGLSNEIATATWAMLRP